MKKIVIIGGGLAGLEVAKKLSGNESFEVILIDKNNYNFFPPLLYQVSTAFIEASNISYPFRRLFQKHKNVNFFMGDFVRLISEQNIVETDAGHVSYDYLILAMGTETNFFGNQNIARNALPMKTIDDAINLLNHILLCLEEASRTQTLLGKEKLVNVVIAGGGPTGVELAGMLGEMRKYIGPKEYKAYDQVLGNVYLVNSGPTLLVPMSRKAQQDAFKVLTGLGIKILLNTLVKDYVNDMVLLSNGESIPAKTLIWASGVMARPVSGLSKESVGPAGRIIVDEINLVKGYDNIFAIGDQCIQFSDNNYPKGHPQLAQVAMQQGRLVGKNLIRKERNKWAKPFTYQNKGSMAIISKHKAVVDLPFGSFKGFIAWLLNCSFQIGDLFPAIFFCSLKRYYQESFNKVDQFIEKELADSLVATLETGKSHHIFDPEINSLRAVQMYCWQIRLAISDTTISEIDRPELCGQLRKFFVSGIATSKAVA